MKSSKLLWPINALFTLLPLVLLLGLLACGSSLSRELAAYEQSADEKALANWLFRNEPLAEAELRQLAEWSLEHRWEFIKLVDHFSERKRTLFLNAFPQQLRASSSYEKFRQEFADSRSHTVQEILQRAADGGESETGKPEPGTSDAGKFGTGE